MHKFVQEFKTFALRGNVMDLAVGVLIGGAFQGIVKSLTDNIINPILGLFGGVNFDEYALTIGKASIKYGAFITSVINFVIMALIVFLLVKAMNRLASLGKKTGEAAAPTTKVCPFCRTEIALDATRCPHCTSLLAENAPDQE